MQIAPPAILIAAIAGHAAQQLLDDIGPRGGMATISQRLTGLGQMQRYGLAVIGIRGGLAHQRDQRAFKPRGPCKTRLRMTFDADMNEDRHRQIVAGDAKRLQIGHGLVQPGPAQPADAGQLVGGDALIGRRIHQVTDDLRQLPATGAGDRGAFKNCPHLFQPADPQRGGKDLHAVFLAAEQRSLLQPGHSGLDAGVVGGTVAHEVLIAFSPDNLAWCRDDLAVLRSLLVQPPQGFEDRPDLVPRQP